MGKASATITRAGIACTLVTLVTTTACAGTSHEPRDARGSYPGRCDLVAVEYADASTEQSPHPDVAERDAMLLVARYRTQDGSGLPIQLGILVRRADAEALRARLAGQPTVACRPDTGEVEPPALPPDAETVPTEAPDTSTESTVIGPEAATQP
jgi:hypothetical protein